MAKSVEELLHQDIVAGVFEGIKPGFPAALPAGFYTVSKMVPATNGLFTYDKVEGTRKTARTVRYNGKSAVRNASGIDTVPVKAIFSSEHMDFDLHKLINLRALGQTAQVEKIAMQEINRRLMEAKQLQQNLRSAAVHLSLLDGILYFDKDGNLLPSNTGSAYSVNWSVPAGNQNQLTDSDGSTIISASWATASTDIIGQVNKIKRRAEDQTGYELKYAVYGSSILGYLLANTAVINLMQSNGVLTRGVSESGDLPNPFLGLEWIRGDKFFWEDNGGTVRRPVGADEVIFLPEPEPSWYDFVETDYLFTDQEGLVGLDAVGSKFGPSIQTKVTSDPVAATAIYRDAFLPVVNVPAAIYIADVTP